MRFAKETFSFSTHDGSCKSTHNKNHRQIITLVMRIKTTKNNKTNNDSKIPKSTKTRKGGGMIVASKQVELGSLLMGSFKEPTFQACLSRQDKSCPKLNAYYFLFQMTIPKTSSLPLSFFSAASGIFLLDAIWNEGACKQITFPTDSIVATYFNFSSKIYFFNKYTGAGILTWLTQLRIAKGW